MFWELVLVVLSSSKRKARRSTEPRKTLGIYCILRVFCDVVEPPGVPKRLWDASGEVHAAPAEVHGAQVGAHKAQVEAQTAQVEVHKGQVEVPRAAAT